MKIKLSVVFQPVEKIMKNVRIESSSSAILCVLFFSTHQIYDFPFFSAVRFFGFCFCFFLFSSEN